MLNRKIIYTVNDTCNLTIYIYMHEGVCVCTVHYYTFESKFICNERKTTTRRKKEQWRE